MQSKGDRIGNTENVSLQCDEFLTLQFLASEQLYVVVPSIQRFVRIVPFIRECYSRWNLAIVYCCAVKARIQAEKCGIYQHRGTDRI